MQLNAIKDFTVNQTAMSSEGEPKYALRHRSRGEDSDQNASKTPEVGQQDNGDDKEVNISVNGRRSTRRALKRLNPSVAEDSGQTDTHEESDHSTSDRRRSDPLNNMSKNNKRVRKETKRQDRQNDRQLSEDLNQNNTSDVIPVDTNRETDSSANKTSLSEQTIDPKLIKKEPKDQNMSEDITLEVNNTIDVNKVTKTKILGNKPDVKPINKTIIKSECNSSADKTPVVAKRRGSTPGIHVNIKKEPNSDTNSDQNTTVSTTCPENNDSSKEGVESTSGPSLTVHPNVIHYNPLLINVTPNECVFPPVSSDKRRSEKTASGGRKEQVDYQSLPNTPPTSSITNACRGYSSQNTGQRWICSMGGCFKVCPNKMSLKLHQHQQHNRPLPVRATPTSTVTSEQCDSLPQQTSNQIPNEDSQTVETSHQEMANQKVQTNDKLELLPNDNMLSTLNTVVDNVNINETQEKSMEMCSAPDYFVVTKDNIEVIDLSDDEEVVPTARTLNLLDLQIIEKISDILTDPKSTNDTTESDVTESASEGSPSMTPRKQPRKQSINTRIDISQNESAEQPETPAAMTSADVSKQTCKSKGNRGHLVCSIDGCRQVCRDKYLMVMHQHVKHKRPLPGFTIPNAPNAPVKSTISNQAQATSSSSGQTSTPTDANPQKGSYICRAKNCRKKFSSKMCLNVHYRIFHKGSDSEPIAFVKPKSAVKPLPDHPYAKQTVTPEKPMSAPIRVRPAFPPPIEILEWREYNLSDPNDQANGKRKIPYQVKIYKCGLNGCDKTFMDSYSISVHRLKEHIAEPIGCSPLFQTKAPETHSDKLPQKEAPKKPIEKEEWEQLKNKQNFIEIRVLDREPIDRQAKEIIINLKNYFEIINPKWNSKRTVQEIAKASKISIEYVHRVVNYFNRYKKLPGPQPKPITTPNITQRTPVMATPKLAPTSPSKSKSTPRPVPTSPGLFIVTDKEQLIIKQVVLWLKHKRSSFGVDDVYQEIMSSNEGQGSFSGCTIQMFRELCRKAKVNAFIRRQLRVSPRKDGPRKVKGYYLCNQPGCIKRFRDRVALNFHLNKHKTKSVPFRPNQTRISQPKKCHPSTSNVQPIHQTQESSEEESPSTDDRNVELKECRVVLRRLKWSEVEKYIDGGPAAEFTARSVMSHMLGVIETNITNPKIKTEPVDTSEGKTSLECQQMTIKKEIKTENFWDFSGDIKPFIKKEIKLEDESSSHLTTDVEQQNVSISEQSINVETNGTSDRNNGQTSDQTEEQQFKCPIDGCDKAFVDRDSLSLHCHWVHRRPLPDLNDKSSCDTPTSS